MIRATHKTIRDYWGTHASRTKPSVHQGEAQTAFRRMLRSAFQAGKHNGRPETRGLTIQDYWRRPVAVRPHAALHHGHKVTRKSSPPESPSTAQPSDDRPESPEATNADAPTALRHRIDQAAGVAARKYDLPVSLVQSVIRHESNYNPRAVSRAGAQGLMQLMPATARELGVNDPFDIRQNIDGGSRYLRQMLDRFDGDVRKALAAYNAGPGTVRRFGGIPPYPETREYISKVMTSAAETV